MKRLNIGEAVIVKTIATEKRNFSGVRFKKGDLYSFTPKVPENWKDWWKSSPLTGFWNPLKFLIQPRLKSSHYYALCGGVGEEDECLFEIGKGLSKYEVVLEGELFLFANDLNKKWAYRNNKGRVDVKIQRIK